MQAVQGEATDGQPVQEWTQRPLVTRCWAARRDGAASAPVTLVWPPGCCSCLTYDPQSGCATLAELDMEAARSMSSPPAAQAREAGTTEPGTCSWTELLHATGAAWHFHWETGFEHTLGLTLQDGSLCIVQYAAASGSVAVRQLRAPGGRSRPIEERLLRDHLAPLMRGEQASQCCLAEEQSGSLVLLRYHMATGAAAIDRFQPEAMGDTQEWLARHVGTLDLLAERRTTCILPLHYQPAELRSVDAVTVLQYSPVSGNVCARSLEGKAGRVQIRALWEQQWMPGYSSQIVANIDGGCCLIEYTTSPPYSGRGNLNMGAFSDNGEYVPPYGDFWRCTPPLCQELIGHWAPHEGRHIITLLSRSDEGLLLCGLPARAVAVMMGGLIRNDWSLVVSTQPDLEVAVREANWRHRRAAVLISTGSSSCAGALNPVWTLRRLREELEGAWRLVISML